MHLNLLQPEASPSEVSLPFSIMSNYRMLRLQPPSTWRPWTIMLAVKFYFFLNIDIERLYVIKRGSLNCRGILHSTQVLNPVWAAGCC